MRRREALGSIAALVVAGGVAASRSHGFRSIVGGGSSISAPTVDPKEFGAKGDGRTDDSAALQAALDSGHRVSLQPQSRYAFGRTLRIPSGGGLVGGGRLIMLTGSGKFDKSDYSGDPVVGLFMQSASDIKVEARIEMEPNQGVRTCSAIWVRGCRNVELDVEASGFRETRFGIIEWNSCTGGSVKANVHDCFVNSNVLPTMQVTALSVDSNRLGVFPNGVNSTAMRFDVRAKDIFFGPKALAKYGYQTDGVNLQGSGYAGHRGRIVAENIHEPLDCWSDNNIVEVNARDCLFGVKLIYGASHNVIRATVDRFMKNALLLGGSATKPVSDNRCSIVASGGGEIGQFGDVAAVAAENSHGAYAPRGNDVDVIVTGDGVHLDYGVLVSDGASNNRFRVSGSLAAVARSRIAASAGPGNSIERVIVTSGRAPTLQRKAFAFAPRQPPKWSLGELIGV